MNDTNEPDRTDDYTHLDRGWEALDSGEPEAALELAAKASDELAETWVLRATALLELGALREARLAADEAALRGSGDEENTELMLVRAEIALREWNLEAAREELERAAALGPNPVVFSKQALLADLSGDFGRADRLLRDAHRLDAQNFPLPARLSERDFDRALQDAIAHLPEPFRATLEEVPVIVDPMPSRELVGDDPLATPPDLLGLFLGESRAEAIESGAGALPPSIHLFQRNLERATGTRRELVEQIGVTLFHELGHYLGFDEDGVAELGLE
ncbi:MAG: metallopeptidase family protein [Planctomycetota bacterium]|nr:metallopeptidase family protein [Planctomycetota bacterium]